MKKLVFLIVFVVAINCYDSENLKMLVQKYTKSPELKKVIGNKKSESKNDMESLKQLWKEKKFKSYENVQYKKEENQKSNELFNKLKKYYSYEKMDSPDFEKMVDQMKNEIFRFQKK